MAWLVTPDDSERDQRRAAGSYAARGLGPGDRVAFTLPTSPALLAAVLGATRTGVVPVLLNPTLLTHEQAELLADADPAFAVTDEAALAALLAGPPAELAPVPLTRPMHYTSGTSGRAKGVFAGVLSEDGARAMHDDEAGLWGFDTGDTLLMCSPLYHSVGVRLSSVALLSGASVVLLDAFDAHAAAEAITGLPVTAAFMVPAHLQRLFSLPALPSLQRVRTLIHAGAPCPHDLKRRAIDAFPAVWEFYGSTEGQFTVCSPEEWLERPGTVGRARPGRRLEIDDDGQIWCHAPRFARFEYWRDPAKTREAWKGDAFTVGDLGRLDAAGYLFIDGRRSDLLISGGVNVYPAEVERVLGELAGIEDVAVFGLPDERWGQRVCAAVVGDVDAAAVLAHAAARLAPHKRPKQVFVVAELPRTGTGKVRRGAVATALGLGSATPREAGGDT